MDFLVLEFSETEIVLLLVFVPERTQMTEPVLDHERVTIDRLAIDYVASSYRVAKSLSGPERHARAPWLRSGQSIPLNIAGGNGKQSLKDKSRLFETARDSALECAAIHDMLMSIEYQRSLVKGGNCSKNF
jgi:four helix bundle protein